MAKGEHTYQELRQIYDSGHSIIKDGVVYNNSQGENLPNIADLVSQDEAELVAADLQAELEAKKATLQGLLDAIARAEDAKAKAEAVPPPPLVVTPPPPPAPVAAPPAPKPVAPVTAPSAPATKPEGA